MKKYLVALTAVLTFGFGLMACTEVDNEEVPAVETEDEMMMEEEAMPEEEVMTEEETMPEEEMTEEEGMMEMEEEMMGEDPAAE